MTIEISVGGGQLLGGRELQEDAYLIKLPKGANAAVAPTLLIVADGIGGQYGGDIASQLGRVHFRFAAWIWTSCEASTEPASSASALAPESVAAPPQAERTAANRKQSVIRTGGAKARLFNMSMSHS